jgi:hypothetical protein
MKAPSQERQWMGTYWTSTSQPHYPQVTWSARQYAPCIGIHLLPKEKSACLQTAVLQFTIIFRLRLRHNLVILFQESVALPRKRPSRATVRTVVSARPAISQNRPHRQSSSRAGLRPSNAFSFTIQKAWRVWFRLITSTPPAFPSNRLDEGHCCL